MRKNFLKKLFASLAALSLVLTLMPVTAHAANRITEIWTPEDLIAFAESVKTDTYSGVTVTLKADINMTGKTLYPIGSQGHAFQGVFEGNNKTISDLSMTYESTSSIKVGLFGYVTGNGTASRVATRGIVRNLKLVNVDVSNGSTQSTSDVESSTGCAVATLEAGLIQYVTTDTNSSASGVYRVAGICGDIRGYGRVLNCDNAADVTGSSQYTGGVVGATHELSKFTVNTRAAHVEDCTNTGTISGVAQVGGIVGYCDRSYILRCTNSGNVTGTSLYGTGGVVGADIYNEVSISFLCPTILSIITDCKNENCTVNAPAGNGGGILGSIVVAPGDSQPESYNLVSELTQCHNTGTIEGPSTTCGGVYGSPITYAHGSGSTYVDHLLVRMTDCTTSSGVLTPCPYIDQ